VCKNESKPISLKGGDRITQHPTPTALAENLSWRPLKINAEYQKLAPPLTKEQYDALENSIKDFDGASEPIIINSEGEILDGHTRYEIRTKNTLGFRTETERFANKAEEKHYVIETNSNRRQLNVFAAVKLALKSEQAAAEAAKQKRITAGKIAATMQGRLTTHAKGRVHVNQTLHLFVVKV